MLIVGSLFAMIEDKALLSASPFEFVGGAHIHF
jgi:hypothetical protein